MERTRLLSAGRWRPEIRDGLEAMVRRHGPERPLAAFDWDNTSIDGDIGEAALMVLDAADGGARMATYERMCVEVGKTVAYPWCAYQIAAMTAPEVRRFTLGIVEAWLTDGRFRVRAEIRELVAAMQQTGWDVWVVSASAEPLVQAFAQLYGVPQDHVLGMRLAVDSSGVYEAALAGPNTYRAGKVEALLKFAGRTPDFAAGDSDTDLEMLASARYRLVLEHGNAELLDAARAGGWWIQPRFESTS